MSAGHDLLFEAQELRNKRRMRPGGALFRIAIALYEVGGALTYEIGLLRKEIAGHRETRDRAREALTQEFVAAVLGSGRLDASLRPAAQRFIAYGYSELTNEQNAAVDELLSRFVPRTCPQCGGGSLPQAEWTKVFEEGVCSWCPGEPLSGVKIVPQL